MDFSFTSDDGDEYLNQRPEESDLEDISEHHRAPPTELDDMLEMVEYKCSICFLTDSEMDLGACGDQFCYSCIEQYWRIKLKEASWGMRPATLDCPVCRQLVTDTNWMRWVKDDVKELYVKSQLTKSQVFRTCEACGHEQSLMGEPLDESIQQLWSTFEGELAEGSRLHLCQKLVTRDFTSILCYLLRHTPKNQITAPRIYLFRKILQICQDDDADLYANKQLAILQLCAGSICDFCQAPLCLRCGSSDWHPTEDCISYLRRQLTLTDDPATLRWKLGHCKHCPKCFLLISRDDDGSCNQMKCNFCGYSFCWECLREWSTECGYYRCGVTSHLSMGGRLLDNSGSRSNSGTSTIKRDSKRPDIKYNRTEAGIPDVTKLPSFSPQ